jgi:hypothetical protein
MKIFVRIAKSLVAPQGKAWSGIGVHSGKDKMISRRERQQTPVQAIVAAEAVTKARWDRHPWCNSAVVTVGG